MIIRYKQWKVKWKHVQKNLQLFLNNTCKYRTKQTPKIMALFNTVLSVSQITTCKIGAGQELLLVYRSLWEHMNLTCQANTTGYWVRHCKTSPSSSLSRDHQGISSEGCVTGRCLTHTSFITAAHKCLCLCGPDKFLLLTKTPKTIAKNYQPTESSSPSWPIWGTFCRDLYSSDPIQETSPS